MNKVYQIIADNFIKRMEEGIIPWKKPWDAPSCRPANLISKAPYNGINILLTSMQSFSSPYWQTFNQARDIGAMVKKGEKGTPIVFYKTGQKENDSGKIETFPVLRYFTVFNTDQIEGIPSEYFPDEGEVALEKITGEIDFSGQRVLQSFLNKPKITTGGDSAYYSPSKDYIKVPKRRYFDDLNKYWATLFHELVHSTGHKDRLNREGFLEHSSYSFEELVAEIGAAFLCHETGISNEQTEKNATAYLQSWSKRLKDKPEWIIKASQKASKAVRCILGKEES